jgi:peptide deformylase
MEATMRESEGVGLAAPQIGVSLQIAVVDLRKVEKRPSALEIGGKPVDWRTQMPLFFCNPTITLTRKREDADEGCLSFPNVYGAVRRSLRIQMDYEDLHGKPMSIQAGGLLARALQHEVDHLQGILFIDRMEPEIRKSIAPVLLELMETSKSKVKSS